MGLGLRHVTKFRKERGGSRFRTGIFRGQKTGLIILGQGGYACIVYAVNETPPAEETTEQFDFGEQFESYSVPGIYPDCPP